MNARYCPWQKAYHRLTPALGPEVCHALLEYFGSDSEASRRLLQLVIGHRASWFVDDDLGLHRLDPVMTQVPVPGHFASHELDIGVRDPLRRVVHAANGHHAVDALRELEAGGHFGESSSANGLWRRSIWACRSSSFPGAGIRERFFTTIFFLLQFLELSDCKVCRLGVVGGHFPSAGPS